MLFDSWAIGLFPFSKSKEMLRCINFETLGQGFPEIIFHSCKANPDSRHFTSDQMK